MVNTTDTTETASRDVFPDSSSSDSTSSAGGVSALPLQPAMPRADGTSASTASKAARNSVAIPAAIAAGAALALFTGAKAFRSRPAKVRAASVAQSQRDRFVYKRKAMNGVGYHAPLAVVTGGSNGIGFELAKQFADHGYDVLIAAHDPGHLATAAGKLAVDGALVETCTVDLSRETEVNRLYAKIRELGRPVDALCVNAGIGLGGAFSDTNLQTELKMIDLNVRGAVQLTKLVVREMVARGNGKILFTSSIAATMPDPFEAVYGSTKVFLRWFGEALRNELKGTGVDVTVLMPSVTDTNFFNRAEMLNTRAGSNPKKDDPSVVAKAGFDAVHAGTDRVVPMAKNKLMAKIADALPDAVAAQIHRGMSQPGSATA